MKKDIASLNWEELQKELLEAGEKKFRASQIYEWIHKKGAEDFSEMTNLSKVLREKLEQSFRIPKVEMIARQISKKDGTNKFLFCLEDGNVVESVLMRYKHGNSVCISSQVGCRMGCRFCASTLDGLERNLEPSEMLGQIYRIEKIIGERVSNVVVMGTGEPLDNYDNLLKFIHLLTDEHGLTYQPEKCDRINLRNCAEDLKPCRGKSADHTGAISAWIHTGEEKTTDAGRKQV